MSSKASRKARHSTSEAGPVEGFDVRIVGGNDYEPTANSDIVVITAGFARKPGMSRDDLAAGPTTTSSRPPWSRRSNTRPTASSILVTNPLDAMCHVAHATSADFRKTA